MSKTPIDISDWPSPEELIARNKAGTPIKDLAAELHCSRTRLTRYIAGDNPVSVAFVDEEERICQSDIRFIEAMRAAIAAGIESVDEGIKVDDTPLLGKRIRGDMPFSGCGSAGAMCAHAAGSMTFTK